MQTDPHDTHPTQTRLLEQVRDSKDHRAWATFHRIYAPLITSFLRRMGVTDTDCEDATQEILMVSHDALCAGKYDRTKGGFRAWLYGVARNKALVAHRKRRRPSRAQSVQSDSGVDLLSNLEDRGDESDRRIWEQEWRYAMLAEAMRHARAILSEKVFDAFLRHAVQRRPVEEVASELGITTSSVYVYKQRALGAIKEWVAHYEAEELEDRP